MCASSASAPTSPASAPSCRPRRTWARSSPMPASVERRFGLQLRYVSGGNSSSLPLLLAGKMPAGINNLRIGEAILQGGRDTFHDEPWRDLDRDAFLLIGRAAGGEDQALRADRQDGRRRLRQAAGVRGQGRPAARHPQYRPRGRGRRRPHAREPRRHRARRLQRPSRRRSDGCRARCRSATASAST